MRPRQVAFPIALVIVTAGLLVPLCTSGTSRHQSVNPMLAVGPRAIPAAVATPTYGVFTCQVGESPITCYDPYQIRHAYGLDGLIDAGIDGHNRTIVIVDAFQAPNIKDQLNVFSSFYEMPGLNRTGNRFDPSLGTFRQIAPDGLTPFDATDDNMVGWAEEISLDVLWAHAIAPGANITLVLAKSNNDDDILSATKYAVDHRLGDVISQSFGENESCVDPEILQEQHEVFAEATRQHITLIASSGDTGAAQGSCDGTTYVTAASSPASDPLVMAVGGTELHAADYCFTDLGCDPTTAPAPGTYEGEVAWNEVDIATGGGFSVLFDEPQYQTDAIRGNRQRGVPDVAYSAAVGHGVLTYLDIPGLDAGWYVFGGTSAGSPQWAAVTAIANQRANQSLGFLNSSLYDIGQSRDQYAASLHDVRSGDNSVQEDLDGDGVADVAVTGFKAGRGWDATTGLGSPNGPALIDNLIRFNAGGSDLTAVTATVPHSKGGHHGHRRVHPHVQ